MKKIEFTAVCGLMAPAPGCSIKRAAVNQPANALASGGCTYEGCEDPGRVAAAIPFGLKVYESLLPESLKHRGLLLADALRLRARKLYRVWFYIVLADGRSFRTTLLRIEDDGLVVGRSSRIPHSEVAALRQIGRRGRGRLIGTVAGAALMIAVIAHPGKRTDTVEDKRLTRGEAAAAGSFFVATGYLLGFCADKPYPEWRPLP